MSGVLVENQQLVFPYALSDNVVFENLSQHTDLGMFLRRWFCRHWFRQRLWLFCKSTAAEELVFSL